MTLDPYFDLTGKIALVTGGSRGLGYQMVRAFAERGADVVIASRKLENCEKVGRGGARAGPPGAGRPVHAGSGRPSTASSRPPTPSSAGSTSWSTTPA